MLRARAAPTTMIDRPLASLQAWTDAFHDAQIPVLSSSAAEVERLALIEEERGTVDAHTLAEAFAPDPLMTLRVLTDVSRYCTRLSVEPPETLVGALVMQGIGPFFRSARGVPTVDFWLAAHPEAGAGLSRVVARARRAAHFALGFAIRRQDEDASVIQEAALLHDFAEMLLWCHAPALAHAVASQLEADHTLRSADVQQAVLGITLDDLGQALMHRWQLPDLLIQTTDARQSHRPKVQNVVLAVRLARHSRYGWDDPHAQAALHDDAADVARLLTLSPEAATRLIMAMDG